MTHSDESPEVVDVPVTDVDSAAAAIANLIPEEDQEEEPTEEVEVEPVDPSEDDEPEEPEIDDEDVDEEEEPEYPAIDAPASLTAEEKERYAKLPPEGQALMREVETRRTQDVQTGLEKARTAQQNAEKAAADQVAQAQLDNAQRLYTFANAYAPQMPPPELAQSNPAQYNYLRANYDAELAQHNELVQRISSIAEEAGGKLQESQKEAIQEEWTQVLDELPEAKEPEKWQQLMQELTPTALALGLPEESIGEATPTEIRAIKRVHDWKVKAAKYDAAMDRKMQRVRKGKVKANRPGSAQAATSGRGRAYTEATNSLRKTGSVDDAANALKNLGL